MRRSLWAAHVPAIGAFTQGRSLLDAARMLERVIEMMFRLDGRKVIVAVMPEVAVKGVAPIAVTCDRRGLFEGREAEFARLSAGVRGPITNPYFVALRPGRITVENNTHLSKWERRVQTDVLRRDAMIYRLGVIGLAAAATTKAFRAKHTNIPWDEVIALRDFLGKPDRVLDHAALRKAMRETIPAVMKALARPDFEVVEVIRLNLTPSDAKVLREWCATSLLPNLKKHARVTQATNRLGCV